MLLLNLLIIMMSVLSKAWMSVRIARNNAMQRHVTALFGSKTRKSKLLPSIEDFDYEALELEHGKRDSVPIS